MPTSKVNYLGELRTEAVHLASGQQVISDAPIDNHGKGQAFSPTDYCASSLAMCMLTVMGIYANRKTYTLTGSNAEVNKVMASSPRRIAEIHVNITIEADRELNSEEQKELKRIALTCPVAKSLSPDIKQVVELNFG